VRATAIEYALVAAGISIAIVAAVGSLGTTLNATYHKRFDRSKRSNISNSYASNGAIAAIRPYKALAVAKRSIFIGSSVHDDVTALSRMEVGNTSVAFKLALARQGRQSCACRPSIEPSLELGSGRKETSLFRGFTRGAR
jgi:hypothetical protein